MIDRIAGSRLALAGLFVVALLTGAGAMWGVQRLSPAGDRAQIEAVVHDYVLSHPEIIPQAIQKLQDQQTGSMVAAYRDAKTRADALAADKLGPLSGGLGGLGGV